MSEKRYPILLNNILVLNGNPSQEILDNTFSNSIRAYEDVANHADKFRAIVVAHINNQLPVQRWRYFRSLAFSNKSCHQEFAIFEQDLSTSQFVEIAQCVEYGPSVRDIVKYEITTLGNHNEVNKWTGFQLELIDGQPMYFLPREGVYLWSTDPSNTQTLSMWLSFPAYPPGW